MRTKSKKWAGKISYKQFLSLFANGFAAPDVQRSSDRFTICMFYWIMAHMPSNRRTTHK